MMWWAGHVARVGEERKMYRVLLEGLKERGHVECQDLDGNVRSEWLLGRVSGGRGVDSVDSR
jgi:hypothetical protein